MNNPIELPNFPGNAIFQVDVCVNLTGTATVYVRNTGALTLEFSNLQSSAGSIVYSSLTIASMATESVTLSLQALYSQTVTAGFTVVEPIDQVEDQINFSAVFRTLYCATAPTIPFQANLLDSAGEFEVQLGSICGSEIEFSDTSNYNTNNDPKHTLALFNYRSVVLTFPDATEYRYCSALPYDAFLAAPSAGITIVNYTPGPYSIIDGLYKATLITIPDYNSSTGGVANLAYMDGAIVHDSGIIYQSNGVVHVSVPVSNSAAWSVITEDDIAVGKYKAEEYFIVDCAFQTCLSEAVKSAYCKIEATPCNDDMLCTNKCLLKAVKLIIIEKTMITALNARDYTGAANALDVASEICGEDCGCGGN